MDNRCLQQKSVGVFGIYIQTFLGCCHHSQNQSVHINRSDYAKRFQQAVFATGENGKFA